MFYIIKKAIIFRFPLGQAGVFLHILECEKQKVHFKSTICRLGLTAADFFWGGNVKEKRPSPNCCIKTVTFILKKSIISKFQDFKLFGY